MTNFRKIGQHDADTGEPIEHGVLVLALPKRQNGFSEGWVAMGQTPMQQLAARGKELGVEGFRVFMYMGSILDYENLINVSHTDMAKTLHMARPNISRAIARLIALDVIIEGQKVGRNRTYRLNPNFGWKGSAKAHKEALAERMKLTGLRIAADNGKTLIDAEQSDIEDFIGKAEE